MWQESWSTREIIPADPGPASPDRTGETRHTFGMETRQHDVVLTRTAWTLALISVALYATIPLSLSGGVMSRPGISGSTPNRDLLEGMVLFAFLVSGGWLIQARPRNPIGWILIASGFFQALQRSFESYGARALTDPDGSLPLGLPAMWVASWAWMPSLALVVAVLPGLYPTGRPASTFWKWQIRSALTGIALLIILAGTVQGGVDDTVRGVRLPWEVPSWWEYVVGVPAGVLVVGTVLVAILGTLVRAVRAGTPERQQLVWLFVFLVAMLAAFFTPSESVFTFAYALCPVAVAVGVLRYQMLGIRVVMRKTLLYGPLTLLVALVVGGTTTALARLIPEGPVPLIAGSAIVAVMVFPVAGWLRRLVDRFVLGDRVDPLAAVDRVGAGLEIADENPVPSMLEAVAAATGARYACVRDESGKEVAQVGEPVPRPLEVPLRHGGRELGTLVVGPRHREPRVTESDARLVAALAPHLAVVVRSRVLTEELDTERQRVTEATLAERDRLRRDLHDGLGPSLSGIALGLEASLLALDNDPATTREILTRTREEAAGAVAEIRRVIDALRPSALDRYGLVGAVRETAAALGMGRPGGLGFDLQADRLPSLAPRVEEAAFRILAESLNNVARHADAHRCTVSLCTTQDELRLHVCDDGVGLDPDHTPGEGLSSMTRRVADLGGRITIQRLAPGGTEVSAMLPLGAP